MLSQPKHIACQTIYNKHCIFVKFLFQITLSLYEKGNIKKARAYAQDKDLVRFFLYKNVLKE